LKKFLLIITLLLSSTLLMAQPFTLDIKFKPLQLKLHKYNPPKEPKAKGRISISQTTQTEDTLFYFVKGASIYSPVYFGIQTNDPSNSVDVSLHKLSWKKAERSGTTNANGYWEQRFKTENDFAIRVIAKEKPVAYSIMVWVGDEAKMELPTVFKKGTIVSGGGNFLKNNLVYIVIAGLIIIILILFFKYKNKK
jgi:preprotein translocase subunit SecF